jgi:hypothetical protein
MFGFQQTVGFPISTKCAPLLVDYSYEADFLQGLPKKNKKETSSVV